MKTTLLVLSISFFLFLSCEKTDEQKSDMSNGETPANSENFYENYLTPADIEKVTGMTGVKSIPRDPKIGAGGNLNFATSDNNLIVMIQVVSKSYYEGYKQFYKGDITNLGEEAMRGATIQNNAENLVAFTKGYYCVALTVFADMKKADQSAFTPMLTIEQTTELAKIIESRM